jgi:hypothetical protein
LDERSGWRSKLGVDELRWAILNASGLESDEAGVPKRKIRTRDVKGVVEEPVKAKVTEEVSSPWHIDEEPIIERREPKKPKDEAHSVWKPAQLA